MIPFKYWIIFSIPTALHRFEKIEVPISDAVISLVARIPQMHEPPLEYAALLSKTTSVGQSHN